MLLLQTVCRQQANQVQVKHYRILMARLNRNVGMVQTEKQRDRDYNHPGKGIPFPHDHEWKDGKRQKGHLPPSPEYEFSLDPVLGVGLVTICVIGIIFVAADDATGIGVADDFLFGLLGAGVGEGFILIFG